MIKRYVAIRPEAEVLVLHDKGHFALWSDVEPLINELKELRGVLNLTCDDYVKQVGTWKIIQRLEEERDELKRTLSRYDDQHTATLFDPTDGKHYTFHRVSVSSPTEGNMTEDEIKDILTCATECPESPFNVDRVEMLVDECLKLRSQLSAFTEGKPSRTDLERLSYFCHEFDYCVDASDWLKRIASMGDK